MTPDNPRGLAVDLSPCPFCGERVDIVSNRDWHRIQGEHAEWCPIEDYEFAAPATHSDLAAAIVAWNKRAPNTALLNERAELLARCEGMEAWRLEVCERLGLSCAAGATWTPLEVWQLVHDEEAKRVAKDDR
jgi:restriction alleviation protein Lar